MKILLVEDNDANASLLKRFLTRHGHEVTVAATGEEGVRTAQAQPLDIIVMDLTLPGIDGFEATRRIKASERSWTVPIVAFTGLGCEAERQRSLEAGCDAFITKPIDLSDLMAQLAAIAASPADDAA